MARTSEWRYRNAFFMDLENWVLEHQWHTRPPTGRNRHIDSQWGDVMYDELWDYFPQITWLDYSDWVSLGYGDEWFQPEESINPNRVNGHHALADDLRRIRAAGG